jgi:hypothetical protein
MYSHREETMLPHSNLITAEIRNKILTRALFTASSDEVTRSIFDVIVEAGIDWRAVSVEEVKPILVDAIRVFLGRTVDFGEPVAV